MGVLTGLMLITGQVIAIISVMGGT